MKIGVLSAAAVVMFVAGCTASTTLEQGGVPAGGGFGTPGGGFGSTGGFGTTGTFGTQGGVNTGTFNTGFNNTGFGSTGGGFSNAGFGQGGFGQTGGWNRYNHSSRPQSKGIIDWSSSPKPKRL